MIYLDNAATTFPKPESVYKVMDDCSRNYAVNANRGSYAAAEKCAQIITETKRKLQKIVNASSNYPVVFAPSITVALNQIISGIKWCSDDVVYISPYEHNAVARTLYLVKKKRNIRIRLLPLKNDLTIDLDKLEFEFNVEHPKAVICTHMSNVTGYILPISKIFSLAKKFNAITILDSAQSLGLIPVDLNTMQLDFLAFTAHKSLYGPLGIGGFINVGGLVLEELIVGGTGSDSTNLDMPCDLIGRYESSSSNIVAIAGFNAALDCLDQQNILRHEKFLTTYLKRKLSSIPSVKLLSPDDEQHISVVSFVIDGYVSEDVGFILDDQFGICVRTGYHCAPFIHEYLEDDLFSGTVRIGIGQFNCEHDIDCLIDAVLTL